ncbi:unnamed protein product [Blepharisma stoltei]|uniref:Uncharacterized protein n=1 Tax=Blepharisma stoltei TaxID=1481888 RepID=A0AAU9JRR2_9CILI|nr:unnamed protein product [Blepharisma stoltei]
MEVKTEEISKDDPPTPMSLPFKPAELPKRPTIPHLPLEKAKKYIQESGGSAPKSSGKPVQSETSLKDSSDWSIDKSPWGFDPNSIMKETSPILKNTKSDQNSTELINEIEAFLHDIKKQTTESKSLSSGSYRDKLNQFRKDLEIKRQENKYKKAEKPGESRLLKHLEKNIKEDFKELHQAISQISAKDVVSVRGITNPNPSIEMIGIIFLLIFNQQIPRFHPWEAFVPFIAQPGLVIQRLRALPLAIDNKEIGDDMMYQVKKLVKEIDPNELAEYNSAQLLYQVLVEISKFCRVSVSDSSIPLSLNTAKDVSKPAPKNPFKEKPKPLQIQSKPQSKPTSPAQPLSPKEILDSENPDLIKKLIQEEQQAVVKLRGAQKKAYWDEKRFTKSEIILEEKLQEEREFQYDKAMKDHYEKLDRENEFKMQKETKEFQDEEFIDNRMIKNFKKEEAKMELLDDIQREEERINWNYEKQKKEKEKKIKELREVAEKVKEERKSKIDSAKIKRKEEKKKRKENEIFELKYLYMKTIQEKEQISKELELYNKQNRTSLV